MALHSIASRRQPKAMENTAPKSPKQCHPGLDPGASAGIKSESQTSAVRISRFSSNAVQPFRKAAFFFKRFGLCVYLTIQQITVQVNQRQQTGILPVSTFLQVGKLKILQKSWLSRKMMQRLASKIILRRKHPQPVCPRRFPSVSLCALCGQKSHLQEVMSPRTPIRGHIFDIYNLIVDMLFTKRT